MAPFTIRCTTCRRQLLVRDPAVIGKLVTCPACGSMVMIEAPDGYASQVKTGEGRVPAQPKPRVARPAGPAGHHAPITAVDPQLADTVAEELWEPQAGSGLSSTNAPNPAWTSEQAVSELCTSGEGMAVPASAEGPGAPTWKRPWTSPRSSVVRRWLLIMVAATALTLLLIVVLGLWANRRPVPGPVAARATNSQTEVAEERPVGTENHQVPAATANGAGDLTDVRRAAASGAETADGSQGSAGGDTKLNLPGTNGTPGGRSESRVDGEAPAVGGEQPTEPLRSGGGTDVGQRGNPTAEPDKPVAQPPKVLPGNVSPRELTVEGALRALEALTADAAFSARPLTGTSLFDLLPTPAQTFDPSLALPKPVTRRPVNLHAQLAIKIPALEFPQVPLADLCRFVQDLTNIPVTLDVDSLHRAGLSSLMRLEVKADNQDLGTVLRQALETQGLEWRTDGTQLLVTVAGMDQMETVTYEVFDLVGADAARQAELVGWVENLVGPLAWKRHGGPGTLNLEQGRLQVTTTRALQYEVRMFCERLRVARAMRPQGRVPEYVADQIPRIATVLPKLAQTITVHEPIGAPFVKLLDSISSQAGITIAVDWQGLSIEGWTPAALARLDVSDVSAAQALQQLLGPMRLSFRVVDAHTIQVTILERAWKLEELEFFPLKPVLDRVDSVDVLRRVRSLFADSLSAAGGVSGRFVVDPVSQTLIVAAPQFRIAQLGGLLERLARPEDSAEPQLPPVE